MTPAPPPGRPAVPGRPEPDTGADALAGLARELDGLRRRLDPLADLSGRVDELGRLLADLTSTVAALSTRRSPTPCPSWLLHPTSQPAVLRSLEELCGWLEHVYLRFPDAVSGLPECWLWHPDLIEELLWLMHAWLAAYQGPTASVALAGDWHDRLRPGVVRRIRQTAGSCSRENHQRRPGWTTGPQPAPTVPGLDALTVIAAWWAERRDQPAPEPPP